MLSNRSPTVNFSNSSIASNKRAGIVGRTRAALSSLSSPVDSWGVSHVPVLSPRQIVPRRTRSSHIHSHRDGDSIKNDAASHRKSNGHGARRAMQRATPNRLLSISSVSTFGAWIPESIPTGKNKSKTDPAIHAINPVSQPIGELMVIACLQAQSPSTVQQQPAFSVEAPVYVNFKLGDCIDIEMGIHPLRMHPPSSVLLFTDQEQDITLRPQTPSTIPSPKAATSMNDTESGKDSDSGSSLHSQRSVITDLDIDTVDRCVDTGIEEQIHAAPLKLTFEDAGVSRDMGYVQAMRLWFEMKEEAALKNCVYRSKTADVVQAVDERIANINTKD